MAVIGEAVRRMERAGFKLEADGGTLRVSPADKLNEVQRDWLRQHKPELLATVAALALPDVRRLVELFDATITCVELDSHQNATTSHQSGDSGDSQRRE